VAVETVDHHLNQLQQALQTQAEVAVQVLLALLVALLRIRVALE
jgi:hypothetical protein